LGRFGVGEFDLSVCLPGGNQQKGFGMRTVKSVGFSESLSVQVVSFPVFSGSRRRAAVLQSAWAVSHELLLSRAKATLSS